jgi:hypothetical protein
MSKSTDGTTNAILVGIAVVLGAVVFVVARDFVMALIAGAGLYALASRAVKARRHLAP